MKYLTVDSECTIITMMYLNNLMFTKQISNIFESGYHAKKHNVLPTYKFTVMCLVILKLY